MASQSGERTIDGPNRIALTIAGFDPSSGAGVTADLQTFAAHGVYGCACPTAITVQSTLGVRRVEAMSGNLVMEVLTTLDEDLELAGVKIGMLAGQEVVEAVCAFLERRKYQPLLVVLDPVVRSSSGAELLQPRALMLVRERLLPLVNVATPNRGELFALLGEVPGKEDLSVASLRLAEQYGSLGLVVTGGDEIYPDDLILSRGAAPVWLRGTHVETTSTHGTGCAFSSALLCELLAGRSLPEAAQAAKDYVETALRLAPGIGHGHGPLNLLWTRTLQHSNSG